MDEHRSQGRIWRDLEGSPGIDARPQGLPMRARGDMVAGAITGFGRLDKADNIRSRCS
jgi:hypothetical protein